MVIGGEEEEMEKRRRRRRRRKCEQGDELGQRLGPLTNLERFPVRGRVYVDR